MKKTIFVTGGAGFIGSHLVSQLLNNNYVVIIIDNFNDYYSPEIKEKNIKTFIEHEDVFLYRGDIRDFQLLEDIFSKHKIDAVIHLAAMAGVRPSIENPLLYEDVNLKGTQNIFEIMKNFNIKKLVAASSSSVYGNNKKVPFEEADVVDFSISPYAATKKSNEVMGHVYHSLYKFDIIFLRFFTVFGPRQRPDLAIHKFLKKIMNSDSIEMYGDGSTGRDYTYVDDIVDGIIKSLEYVINTEEIYEIINLGNSQPILLRDMIKIIENVCGKKADIIYKEMQPGDVDLTYASIEKASKLLKYKPKTSFEEGIKKFVKWYKEEYL